MNEITEQQDLLSFKEMKRMIPCAVCQLPSSGRHYGVFSCGGCRNFFKRSLDIGQSYRCDHLELVPTLKCRKCRFQKCLQVGMSLEAISIGRPTDKDKFEVSSIIRDYKLQNSDQTSRKTLENEQPKDSLDFKTKLFESVRRFNKTKTTTSSDLNHLDISWPVSHVCSIISQSIEKDIRKVGKFFKAISRAEETIGAKEKIEIFSNSVFKLLAFRSIEKYGNPACHLFGIGQQSLPIIYNLFPNLFGPVEDALLSLTFDFENNNFSEEERAIIYGLIAFDDCRLPNCGNYQGLVQTMLSINQLNSPDSHRNRVVLEFSKKIAQVHSPMLKLLQQLFQLQTDSSLTILLFEVIENCCTSNSPNTSNY